MARFARVVAAGVPHHITQRGNAGQFVLTTDAERGLYLDLLVHYSALHQLLLVGYCLMSNHVHVVAIPEQEDSLALTFKYAHGRYATQWNVRHDSSGHAWQGRFFSCPLDTAHLWAALRYVELNPVRARLAARPEDYVYSSAAVHCGVLPAKDWLHMDPWRSCWTSDVWRGYLACGTDEAEAEAIRENTHTGRPLGSPEFVEALEQVLQRPLEAQSGGRPRKGRQDDNQTSLAFDRE